MRIGKLAACGFFTAADGDSDDGKFLLRMGSTALCVLVHNRMDEMIKTKMAFIATSTICPDDISLFYARHFSISTHKLLGTTMDEIRIFLEGE